MTKCPGDLLQMAEMQARSGKKNFNNVDIMLKS
jgi:hypothetical protein